MAIGYQRLLILGLTVVLKRDSCSYLFQDWQGLDEAQNFCPCCLLRCLLTGRCMCAIKKLSGYNQKREKSNWLKSKIDIVWHKNERLGYLFSRLPKVTQKYNSSYKLLVFSHRNLIKNITQTAVINGINSFPKYFNGYTFENICWLAYETSSS